MCRFSRFPVSCFKSTLGNKFERSYVQIGMTIAITATICPPGNCELIPRLGGEIEDVWTTESEVSWLEGPSYGAGDIWFADPGNIWDLPDPTRLMRFDPDTGTTSTAIGFDVDPNIFGTAFDNEGRLIATHLGLGSVTRRSVDQLDQIDVLAQGLPPGAASHTFIPNDVVVDDEGGIYFTSFMINEPESLGDSAVFYINPAGELSKAADLVDNRDANGIGLSPDGRTLYVAYAFQVQVRRFDVSEPGVIQNERPFATSPGGVDGLTVDRHGNVFASDLGLSVPPTPQPDLPSSLVRVFNSAGDELLTFDPPHGAINMAFGPDDTLYIAGWNNLSRVPIKYVEPTKIVSPHELTDVDGNGADTTEGNLSRNQQVFPASEFDELESGTHVIREIAFRPDRSLDAPAEATYEDFTIRMSLTDADVGTMDLEFDNNFKFSPMTVYEGELTVTSENRLAANGETKEFDQIISLQEPFLYNPDDGNLLIEYRVDAPLDVATNADFFGDGTGSFISYIGDPNATFAHPRTFGGFVTEFTFEQVSPGDFDADGVLRIEDLNSLSQQSAGNENNPTYDLDNDGIVNEDDVAHWAKTLKGTWIGDANLDGEFNTSDLIAVLQKGQYEDDISGNSGWDAGDWNGDGDFDAGDLVAALQDGGFGQGPRPPTHAVPEPSTAILLSIAALWLRRQRH